MFVQLAFPFLGNDPAWYWAGCHRQKKKGQKGTETRGKEGSVQKMKKKENK
jgi:hypothetical protein